MSRHVAQSSPLRPVQEGALFCLVSTDSDFWTSSNNTHAFMAAVLYHTLAMPVWPQESHTFSEPLFPQQEKINNTFQGWYVD